MTRSLGNIIADSLQLGLDYANRLLKDMPADQFGRFATPGGQPVESNHAAFVFGHLSLYPGRILTALGQAAPPVPDGFEACFSKDARCVDDPDSTVYPPMDQIVTCFQDGYSAALSALRAADDSVLQQPNPMGGRMTELFPTIGSMHAFYVGGHMMMHLGQVSAWRRMLGLGAA
ncbi:MAG: hypothetical protein R3C59_14850 [Planctomycetaceae bacterium]